MVMKDSLIQVLRALLYRQGILHGYMIVCVMITVWNILVKTCRLFILERVNRLMSYQLFGFCLEAIGTNQTHLIT